MYWSIPSLSHAKSPDRLISCSSTSLSNPELFFAICTSPCRKCIQTSFIELLHHKCLACCILVRSVRPVTVSHDFISDFTVCVWCGPYLVFNGDCFRNHSRSLFLLRGVQFLSRCRYLSTCFHTLQQIYLCPFLRMFPIKFRNAECHNESCLHNGWRVKIVLFRKEINDIWGCSHSTLLFSCHVLFPFDFKAHLMKSRRERESGVQLDWWKHASPQIFSVQNVKKKKKK